MQRGLKMLVISVAGLVFLSISGYVLYDYFVPPKKLNKNYSTATHLPMDGVDPKEIWVDQMRTENEIVQGKVDYIHELIVTNRKEEEERDTTTQSEIDRLKRELEQMKSELKNGQSHTSNQYLKNEIKTSALATYGQASWDSMENSVAIVQQEETFAPLSVTVCPEATNLHHVNRAIPAGTTVKAILLSSVDVPCGVKGGSDPLPVKLRIIANGRLPHEVCARLKGGIVTASVYGDLSSERAYFRLEKLTQVRSDGHYIETQVAGYVSGEDGKYGLRGTVVDKSALLIENALISGFLSGASEFFQAAALAKLYPNTIVEGAYGYGNLSSSSWGQTAGQLAVAGGTQGVNNSLDALTEYFIKRAEQLRPVIQITPGRIIDITFSDRADLGDLYTHERVRNSGKQGVACVR